MALNKAKTILVTSVSGGVGKTTTVLNLAGILSNLGKKTLILDLDFSSGDIAAMLNIKYDKDIYSLYEDLNNKKFTNFEDYVVKYDENISVLPSLKDPRFAHKIGGKILEVILYKARLKYDVILMDSSHVLTNVNLFALDYSDEILYIINNSSMNLKNMKTFVSILNNMEKTNYKIILNNSNDRNKDYYDKFDIKNIINKNINYVIPSNFYQKNIDKYIIEGKILTLDKNILKKQKRAIKIFNLIVSDILEESKGDKNV